MNINIAINYVQSYYHITASSSRLASSLYLMTNDHSHWTLLAEGRAATSTAQPQLIIVVATSRRSLQTWRLVWFGSVCLKEFH